MKSLPENLKTENCILLVKHEVKEMGNPIKTEPKVVGKEAIGTFRTSIYVFNHNGTFIGKIENAEFVPK